MVEQTGIVCKGDIRVRCDRRRVEHGYGRPIKERAIDHNGRRRPRGWDEEEPGNQDRNEDSGCDCEISYAARRIGKSKAPEGGATYRDAGDNAVDTALVGHETVHTAPRCDQTVATTRRGGKSVHPPPPVHAPLRPTQPIRAARRYRP